MYLNKGLWVVLAKQVLHRCTGADLSDTLASVWYAINNKADINNYYLHVPDVQLKLNSAPAHTL